VILTLLGVMPGMPHFIILPAAGLAGTVAWKLRKAKRAADVVAAMPQPVVAANPSQIQWDEVSDGAALSLELGYGLISLVDERKGAPLMARITGIRRQLSRELGFVVPLVRVREHVGVEVHALTLGRDPGRHGPPT
jgi:flagellar biosynthesis protein FlhA